MLIKKKLRKLIGLIGLGFVVRSGTGGAAESAIAGKVYESRSYLPFPLQKGGERLDVLVKVGKADRAHGLYLILVEDRSWPMKKKENLRRVHKGWLGANDEVLPFPFRIRLQIDPLEKSNTRSVDRIFKERSPAFSQYMNQDKEIWRAQALFLDLLPEGIYRVRLENLAPLPQIDFTTLFAFEKDTRKF
ncbi:hypothetical protein I5R65_17365 [Herbaspirillum sp. AP02]|uniref:hypothetical protein n=1 Tax=unclassified Herbaspirillum TaxID=2624150 RepID=UPI0015DB1445|nr:MULTISPECIES: hypothetical protein [unclassified Herbaspirillum]MBG7621236.1 hypothetical protein [Herbaspirillum sp. AP02]NZD68965.1 hypothetical protein [Herbaspirillum sp. AP21]